MRNQPLKGIALSKFGKVTVLRVVGVIAATLSLTSLTMVTHAEAATVPRATAPAFGEAGLTRLYLAYFKRRPDPEGLAFWMGRAAQGRDPPPGLAVVRSVSRVQRHLRTTRQRGLCHARLSERPWSRPRPAGIRGLGRTAQWRTPRPRRSDGRLLRVKRVPVERWHGGPHGTRHANDSVHLSNARRSSNKSPRRTPGARTSSSIRWIAIFRSPTSS